MSWILNISMVILGAAAAASVLLWHRGSRRRAPADEAVHAALLETVMRASADAITIATLHGGKFLAVSDGFTLITGVERQEALGRTSRELRIWADLDARARMVEELLASSSIRDVDTVLRHKSGELRLCTLSADLIDFQGEPCILAVARDQTERRRAEEAQRHMEDERLVMIRELEATNTELERFAYSVSHDLKSPLVTISGFLGFLEQDIAAGKSAAAARDIERIKAATVHMQRLVDDLLELSLVGRQANPSEEIALAELVREVTDLLDAEIRVRGVEIDVDPELPQVLGDRPRFAAVFQNLIGNAVKFMGDQPSPRLEIGRRHDGPEEVLYVRDNGIGIEEAHQRNVFGLFDRVDPQAAGTGIGLALVKRIVEVHGGRIWVESEGTGKGSTFCLTLPANATQGLRPGLT